MSGRGKGMDSKVSFREGELWSETYGPGVRSGPRCTIASTVRALGRRP